MKKSFNFSILIKGGLWVSLFCLSACQSYRDEIFEIKNWVFEGRYVEAEQKLISLATKQDDNELLYLMELGSVYQIEGKFKESNDVLQKADRLADIKDYTSLSRETGAFLIAEGIKQYKGEDFEIVMINAMSAINYLALSNPSEALVEVRRLNEKINRFRDDSDRRYFKNNAFAYFLAGVIWEVDGKWDDAYLAYNDAYKANPGSNLVRASLLNAAKRSRRNEEYKKLKELFTDIHEFPNTKGELIVLYLQGWGPEKRYNPEDYRFPMMYPSYSYTRSIEIEIPGFSNVKAEPLYDVQEIATESLNDQFQSYLTKKVTGIFAKAILSDQIRQKNETLGNLAWIFLNLSDRADLRQWTLLPESLQAARIPLEQGEYTSSFKSLNSEGQIAYENFPEKRIEIKNGEKRFVVLRSLK